MENRKIEVGIVTICQKSKTTQPGSEAGATGLRCYGMEMWAIDPVRG